MPVVAALLFEFCLRELRLRTLADRTDRKLSTLGWLHPAERILGIATGARTASWNLIRPQPHASFLRLDPSSGPGRGDSPA